MFQGTIPNKVLKVVSSIVKEWYADRIYVGCSGNFSIERSISGAVKAPIMSSDSTMYSSYLGKYFAGDDLGELRIKDTYSGPLDYLRDFMASDADKVATMMLAADILPYSFFSNAYGSRMLGAWKEQYARIHEDLVKKLTKVESKVDSFYHGDVMSLLDMVESDCGFICFPQIKGGSQSMWKHISEFFEYDAPDCAVFDPKVQIEEFCKKVKKVDNFLILAEKEIPELAEYSSGVANSKADDVYFYGKSTKTHYLGNIAKGTRATPIPRLLPEQVVTEKIAIKEITLDQFQEIRALYLSTGVTKTGTPSASYGLFCEGRLFGVFALSDSYLLGSPGKLEKPSIYLLTDFSVVPTVEKNLSKLVLYCILSKEAKLLAEKIAGKQVNSISTNAFSKNPSSMKYRGIFEPFGRKVVERDKEGKPIKYNLTYGASMGKWNLKEAYLQWRQKS